MMYHNDRNLCFTVKNVFVGGFQMWDFTNHTPNISNNIHNIIATTDFTCPAEQRKIHMTVPCRSKSNDCCFQAVVSVRFVVLLFYPFFKYQLSRCQMYNKVRMRENHPRITTASNQRWCSMAHCPVLELLWENERNKSTKKWLNLTPGLAAHNRAFVYLSGLGQRFPFLWFVMSSSAGGSVDCTMQIIKWCRLEYSSFVFLSSLSITRKIILQ